MKIPLIICALIVAATVFFLAGVVVGNVIPGNTLAQDSLSAWVSAFSSAVVGILTFVLAIETWRLRAAQTKQLDELRRDAIRPNINVELVPNRVGVNFMDVVVRNYGKGIARKVKFVFLDRAGNVIDFTEDPIILACRKLGMFTRGFESMGVGHEFKAFLFSFFDLGARMNSDIFSFFLTIRVSFEDVEQFHYSEDFVVDFAQFRGLGTLGNDPMIQIANELKSIKELMPRASNGRMQVDSYDSADRNQEGDQSNLDFARFRERHSQN